MARSSRGNETPGGMNPDRPERQGYASPEAAALAGFPEKAARLIASCADGDDAYVLLETGSDTQSYLYGVNCSRVNGRWQEGASGNGGGWSQAGSDPALGTVAAWNEAPPEADAVRLEFAGVVQDVPVTHGVYLAVWWRVPCPEVWGPRLEAYRIKGAWIPAERYW